VSTTAGRPVRRAPTLEVVAARAGVSRGTASRVLTGSPKVSPQAREAVLRAAAELDYTPNRAARALVTRRSDSVAFVVSEPEDKAFSDPFFVHLLRGAQAEVARAGLQLVFIVATGEDDARRLEKYAAGGHLDGVVLVSLHGRDRLPNRLERIGIPVVLSGRPMVDDGTIHYVDSDNTGGGASAVQVLVERGCKRIATIAGPQDMSAACDRLAGYRAALREAGRRPRARDIVFGDFSHAGGVAAMRRLLAEAPDVDGVFAANDLMAVGAMQVALEAGRRIPDDLAMVGFDDVPTAMIGPLALTTVRQPIQVMGQRMAQILLDRIEGRTAPRMVVLDTEVIRRETA
jgi:DNA-binding LacI/PurR family transcriptional regulator